MPATRKSVKPPKWGYYPGLEGCTLEVGDEEIKGSVKRRSGTVNLRRYHVFLDGEKIGTVEQTEVRATRPLYRGSRIVTVIGHPIEWAWGTQGRGVSYRLSTKQLNEAVYKTAEDHLADSGKRADREQA